MKKNRLLPEEKRCAMNMVLQNKESLTNVAKRFNVSPSAICSLIKRWKARGEYKESWEDMIGKKYNRLTVYAFADREG